MPGMTEMTGDEVNEHASLDYPFGLVLNTASRCISLQDLGPSRLGVCGPSLDPQLDDTQAQTR